VSDPTASTAQFAKTKTDPSVPCRAQRAIRQRTKDHIESLTRRIEELTQTSDLNARLNQALQRNEELVQENKSIRDKLNSIVKAVTEGQREYPPDSRAPILAHGSPFAPCCLWSCNLLLLFSPEVKRDGGFWHAPALPTAR
jgi:hypothetical protein